MTSPATPSPAARPLPLPRGTLVGQTMAACVAYGLGAGTRSSFGMLVQPLVTATGLSYDRIRLVIAVAQLASGLAGPLAGAMALRTSDRTALVTGALMVAGGLLTARGARARGGAVRPRGTGSHGDPCHRVDVRWAARHPHGLRRARGTRATRRRPSAR